MQTSALGLFIVFKLDCHAWLARLNSMKSVKLKSLVRGQAFRFDGSNIVNVAGSVSPCGSKYTYWTQDPESGNYVPITVSSETTVLPVNTEQQFHTHVLHCARCGGNHDNVLFMLLDNSNLFSHWGVCPTNSQPILMRVEPTS